MAAHPFVSAGVFLHTGGADDGTGAEGEHNVDASIFGIVPMEIRDAAEGREEVTWQMARALRTGSGMDP